MTYSKFRLKDSKKEFYYNMDEGALYNSKNECLSQPAKFDDSFYEKAKSFYGTRKKAHTPVGLRILFGHACNYSCGYCLQKDIGNPNERPENKNLQPFIDSLEKNLDLQYLEKVEFWGGEPFLYWKDIMPVMKYLDKKGRIFYIATNGSPLRQKHIDFFNSLEATITVGISHDGPGQEEMRGEDIFGKASVVDAIKQMDKLYPKVMYCFNTVVTKANYDVFKINSYFKDIVKRLDLKNYKLGLSLGKIYDASNSVNSSEYVIGKADYAKFEEILTDYTNQYIKQFKAGGDKHEMPLMQSNYAEEITTYALALKNKTPITNTTNCGADHALILSIDIMGNIRLCPHASENYIAGKIDNLKGIRIVQLDLKRKTNHCGDCNVRPLCKSSCPIQFPDEVFLQNCAIEKIWYGVQQKASFKMIFGEEVELVALGIEDIEKDQREVLAV